MLDHTGITSEVERPCPAPPLDIRPRHFSVTEIETLRYDPYAIYAKKSYGSSHLKNLFMILALQNVEHFITLFLHLFAHK